MGIKSLFGFGQARDKPVRNYSNGEYTFNFGRSTSGKSVNEMTAMQTTAVYACVRILSEAIASLPIHVYRYKDGGKEMVCDHPLYTLLHDEPNPEMISFVFRETLMSHLLIWGNAYAQIIRNGKGEVLSLYPLLPNKMSVERDSNGVLYYVYSRYTDENPNMKKMGDIILRQEDVLHIPGLGFDGLIGYSPIAMARNAVGMTMACEEYGASFFAKVKKRLNIAAFAEGIVNGIENIRLPESILPSPEDMCMSLQGDVQKLTLFNEMCQTVSCFDEAKMDRLAMAAGFVGTSEFTDITYIAKHLDEFEIHPQIHTDKEYGEFLVKEAGMFEVDELLLPHIDYAGVARDKRQATMADSGFIPEGFVGTQRAIHEYQEYQGEFADLLEKNGIPCETFCLYSSLAGMMYQDGEEQETLYRSELADYEEQIQKAILKERHVEEEPRGLMHYFDGNRQVAAKVISAFPKVQNIRGELFGVLECSICQPLTQKEIYELKNFWDGQMSDGWGEGFEQRPIYTQEGELYVSFWTQERHWGVMTEEELDRVWNHGMTQTL